MAHPASSLVTPFYRTAMLGLRVLETREGRGRCPPDHACHESRVDAPPPRPDEYGAASSTAPLIAGLCKKLLAGQQADFAALDVAHSTCELVIPGARPFFGRAAVELLAEQFALIVVHLGDELERGKNPGRSCSHHIIVALKGARVYPLCSERSAPP